KERRAARTTGLEAKALDLGCFADVLLAVPTPVKYQPPAGRPVEEEGLTRADVEPDRGAGTHLQVRGRAADHARARALQDHDRLVAHGLDHDDPAFGPAGAGCGRD